MQSGICIGANSFLASSDPIFSIPLQLVLNGGTVKARHKDFIILMNTILRQPEKLVDTVEGGGVGGCSRQVGGESSCVPQHVAQTVNECFLFVHMLLSGVLTNTSLCNWQAWSSGKLGVKSCLLIWVQFPVSAPGKGHGRLVPLSWGAGLGATGGMQCALSHWVIRMQCHSGNWNLCVTLHADNPMGQCTLHSASSVTQAIGTFACWGDVRDAACRCVWQVVCERCKRMLEGRQKLTEIPSAGNGTAIDGRHDSGGVSAERQVHRGEFILGV